VLGFAALVSGSAAGQTDPAVALQQAVEHYTEALHTSERDARLAGFHRSEQLFAQATAAGVRNADLYTNQGNAALQAERLGSAVLAYRRALRLDPDQPRALQNLQHVRSLLPEWVPKPEDQGLLDTFFSWHRTLSSEVRSNGAALAFAVAALLVAAGIRFGQSTLRNAALLPALVWVALLASVLLDPVSEAREEAVLIADGSIARAADSPLAPSAFPEPLPAGVEVRILETRSPWLRVRLANGRDAWLAESSVARVDGS
jgi:tetratricopeptide (TPR) repeat protein